MLELEPVATARYVSGRVLDGGVPVARAAIWVSGILSGSGSTGALSSQAEGESDAEGRFSVLWNPRDPAERVAIQARDPFRARIAHAGPMSPGAAVDLVLEFEATVEVPVFFAGASEGEIFSIRVEVEGSDEHRPWWDAKVAASTIGHGAMGGVLALPERSPVHLRLIGPSARLASVEAAPELRFDPASPVASVSFDVARPEAFLRGRVVLPPGADPQVHRVVVENDGVRGATFAAVVDAQGGFEFAAIPLGSWELLLVRAESRGSSRVVGQRRVQLSEDLDDVVLVASGD